MSRLVSLQIGSAAAAAARPQFASAKRQFASHFRTPSCSCAPQTCDVFVSRRRRRSRSAREGAPPLIDEPLQARATRADSTRGVLIGSAHKVNVNAAPAQSEFIRLAAATRRRGEIIHRAKPQANESPAPAPAIRIHIFTYYNWRRLRRNGSLSPLFKLGGRRRQVALIKNSTSATCSSGRRRAHFPGSRN